MSPDIGMDCLYPVDADGVAPHKTKNYRYLNSGNIAGKAGDILGACTTIAKQTQGKFLHDDQRAWNMYYIANPDRVVR